APPSGSVSETNNECQIKFKLLHLKAGAAYLPLDPDYPAERLAFMVEDARPLAVLTRGAAIAARLPEGAKLLRLDHPAVQVALATGPDASPTDALRTGTLRPHHPAYVIYTSGSTGRPKGVVVTHAGVPSLTGSHIDSFAITPDSRVLQFASISFDTAFCD